MCIPKKTTVGLFEFFIVSIMIRELQNTYKT